MANKTMSHSHGTGWEEEKADKREQRTNMRNPTVVTEKPLNVKYYVH